MGPGGGYLGPVPPPRLDPPLLETARRRLRRRDPALGAVIRRVGPCGLAPRGDPYRSLVRSVLYQQIAGAAARAIEGRFKALFGGRIPRAERLAAASEAELRSAGLSGPKIRAIHAIAEAFAEGRVSNRRLARMEDDAVIEAVTRIHGVGVWTAHMLLMFSLRRPDVLPVGDYGVRKGARLVYELDELPDAAQLEALADPWRPYRSVASWYLWRATEVVTME